MIARIVLTGALALCATAAHASVTSPFECGAARSVPAERNDRDPVIKTNVLTSFTAGSDRFTDFTVVHYTASGEVYKREEQYRDIRLQTTKGYDRWTGVSLANPALIMTGTLSEVKVKGQKRTIYVERLYRNGKLSITTTSICRGIDIEDWPQP